MKLISVKVLRQNRWWTFFSLSMGVIMFRKQLLYHKETPIICIRVSIKIRLHVVLKIDNSKNKTTENALSTEIMNCHIGQSRTRGMVPHSWLDFSTAKPAWYPCSDHSMADLPRWAKQKMGAVPTQLVRFQHSKTCMVSMFWSLHGRSAALGKAESGGCSHTVG